MGCCCSSRKNDEEKINNENSIDKYIEREINSNTFLNLTLSPNQS